VLVFDTVLVSDALVSLLRIEVEDSPEGVDGDESSESLGMRRIEFGLAAEYAERRKEKIVTEKSFCSRTL